MISDIINGSEFIKNQYNHHKKQFKTYIHNINQDKSTILLDLKDLINCGNISNVPVTVAKYQTRLVIFNIDEYFNCKIIIDFWI